VLQGIVAAVVFASSKTEEELVKNMLQAMKMLLWLGVRTAQCVPFAATVNSEVAQESKQLGYGVPTPMLAVFHLPPDTLLQHIHEVNRLTSLSCKTPDRQIELSLVNGRRALVVSGHPGTLHICIYISTASIVISH
jgi:fatty acid synthase subunit beta